MCATAAAFVATACTELSENGAGERDAAPRSDATAPDSTGSGDPRDAAQVQDGAAPGDGGQSTMDGAIRDDAGGTLPDLDGTTPRNDGAPGDAETPADASDAGQDGGALPEPRCGDGHLDPLEDCDHSGESATCNSDCSTRSCGDGKTNATAGEQCDDGKDGDALNGCSDACAWSCLVDGDCAPLGRRCGDTHACEARTFGAPIPIATQDSVRDLDVVMDGRGNALAVWGDGAGLQHAWYSSAAGWTAASMLVAGGKHPRVASDGRGNLLLAYSMTDATTADLEHVRVRRYRPASGAAGPDANGWRPEHTVRSYPSYNPLGNNWIMASVAVGSNGDAWLAWRVQQQETGGSGSSTWVAHCPNANDSCNTATAIDNNSRLMGHPRVVTDNQADYPIVVWSLLVFGGDDSIVRAARRASVWSTASTVAMATAPEAANLMGIAADGTGQAWVAIRRVNGSVFSNTVLRNRRDAPLADFAWGTPLVSPCPDAALLDFAANGSGDLLAYCGALDAVTSSVALSGTWLKSGSQTWSALSPLDALPVSAINADPRAMIDGFGHGAVIWETSNGAQSAIAASRVTSGAVPTWSPAGDVSARTVNTIASLDTAVEASGQGLAIWVEDDGNAMTIRASALR